MIGYFVFSKKQRLLILSVLFSVLYFTDCDLLRSPFGAPTNLRCEYRTAPLGIDASQPRFSWFVNDNRRGAVQTASQILVATSEKKLEDNGADVWDSGKIESDQSVHVAYGGPGLESRNRYYWKVRTWDGEGQPSPYSEISWWEMGLLKTDDWNAQWIGKKEQKEKLETKQHGSWIWHPEERSLNIPIYFRKDFELPADKKVADAFVKVTADNEFTIVLNETYLGGEANWERFHHYQIDSLLKVGKNLLALTATNTMPENCGLIFEVSIQFEDGTKQVALSDESTKTTFREETGWRKLDFNDVKWKPAHIVAEYGGGYWKKISGEPFEIPRSILVRNEFDVSGKIQSARAYVTGLGSYVLHLNGQRIGQDIFMPGWTHYPERLQYQIYDVTNQVKPGENAVGAVLGNVWWSGGLGWRGGQVYSEGPLRFLMQLHIDYEDGSSQIVTTDKTWKTHESPILENTIYHGETYDARLELDGWDKPNFDDSQWEPAIGSEVEEVKLVAQQGPTIRVTQELTPVKITEPKPGIFVFDFGQNMVGRARLQVEGQAGTRIEMKFAELLHEDSTVAQENLRSAKATDVYILKGDGVETWEPHFTYHGFRYVEVSGFPGTPTKESLTGRIFHSAAPFSGKFTCSNDLLNQIQKNIVWAQRGNMMSVPTDCPQRDERLGWMGDAQIFAPTSCYNMNMARFYAKWMRDIIDCQHEEGYVYDVNPAIVVGGPAKPGWGDAAVVVPWVVYQFYGDKRIIEENYEGMRAWVEYMKGKSENYLYRWGTGEWGGYGDWIAPVESPKHPIAAAYFYYSTKLLSKMAAIIDRRDDAVKYAELAGKIADAFNEKYLDKQTNQYEGATQTANLLPLAFGITPEERRSAVVENIVRDVKDREVHLSTGFLGTAYLLPILSEYGYHDLAYKLATQKTCPSWGYMVEKGATTIWELWDSDKQPPEKMNSRNHFALGSVGEWFYGYLAGLRPDQETPGFKRTIIAPKPVDDLSWAEASLTTEYGLLMSRWEKADGRFKLSISIPANTDALVYIPALGKAKPTLYESGQILVKDGEVQNMGQAIELENLGEKLIVVKVGAGTYTFLLMTEAK